MLKNLGEGYIAVVMLKRLSWLCCGATVVMLHFSGKQSQLPVLDWTRSLTKVRATSTEVGVAPGSAVRTAVHVYALPYAAVR